MGDEANLYSCYCSKHGHSKSKCHNLHNIQLFFLYLLKELHKQGSECSSRLAYMGQMMPNSTVMTMVAIFKSQLLKWLLQEKFKYFCNQIEVASEIKHAVTIMYFLWYKNLM